MKLKLSVLALLPFLGVTACSSTLEPRIIDQSAKVKARAQSYAQESVIENDDVRRIVRNEAFIPAIARDSNDQSWLTKKKVSLKSGEALPLNEVIKSLANQGVNIVSDLPLDRYSYNGFAMTSVDAQTALRMVLGSIGLDYVADANKKLVSIRPMANRTWYLNIGNRKSSFQAGNPSGSSTTTTASSSTNANAATMTPQQTVNVNSSISATDDFWASLRLELDARMKVMLPEQAAAPLAAAALPSLPPVPGMGGAAAAVTPSPAPAPAPSAAPNSGGFVAKQIGLYSVNPETGAVTVQAPHWILGDLDKYMSRVQEMYNTDIIFSGELVSVSVDDSVSEGLDISAFGRYAGRWGAAVANNALGGVTVSFPNGSNIPNVSLGGSPISSTAVGLYSKQDGLSVFNAYLSKLGAVTILQKPHVATTHGVPGDFRRTVTRYYNTVTQQTSSSTTNSAVGTQNTLVPLELGTILRINPRIDLATGLIRAHIVLEQISETGTQSINQSLSTGDALQQVTTEVPILSKVIYSGETLLKDGDMIVVGGQTESLAQRNRDGVTGAMDVPGVGKAFGTTAHKIAESTTYFAMKVRVQKRQ